MIPKTGIQRKFSFRAARQIASFRRLPVKMAEPR
jgi:hypothetical protein